MDQVNREYKDRLFKFIFGNPENKQWTLSLYNAVNGSAYTDTKDVTLTTIEDAVYMNMKNDVSFLVGNTMNLYEQQSTFNPNMPMRFLIYAGMIYSKYIEQNADYHQYSSMQQKAPTPKCICFYNGSAELEERMVLNLRDAFAEEGDIDVRVTMLNINQGRNQQLLDLCEPLREYAWFVAKIREKQTEMNNLEAAIDAAISEMPEEFAIRSFLLSNKAEVKRMCITEYNEARTRAEDREEGRMEGRIEGREEGRTEGRIEILTWLVRKGKLDEKEAAEEAGIPLSEFQSKAALIPNYAQ